MGSLQRGCQRHRTKVASHTAVPMGTAKWLVWCYTHYFKPAFTVGDMSSSCPLPTARFWVWVSLYPAISKHLTAFLYGWLPLSNAYGIPSLATQHKSNTNSISFHCSTTQNLSPFRGSVNGCVLSRGSVLRTSPPACILSCLWHYFI